MLKRLGKILLVVVILGVAASWSEWPHPTSDEHKTTPPDIKRAAENQLLQTEHYPANPTARSGVRLHTIHDTGEGGIIVKYHQFVDDIEIFRQELNLLFDRKHHLITTTGELSNQAQENLKGFQLQPAQAIGKAFQTMGGDESPDHWRLDQIKGDYHYYVGNFPFVDYQPRKPARLKKVFFPKDQDLIPAYSIELVAGDFDVTRSEAQSFVVSALNGEILFRKNQKSHAAFSYRVYAQPSGDHAPLISPYGNNGLPNPTGAPATPPYLPNPVSQSLITLQNGPIKSNDPWLDEQAISTRGNNVDVTATVSNTTLSQALRNARAPISAISIFDYLFSSKLGPFDTSSQGLAAMVQMFYTLNYLHDDFYNYGFNETSGNAQSNNYGRGGQGGDPLLAKLQDDLLGRDNAMIVTPADGESPEMEMSLWSGSQAIGVTVNQEIPITFSKVGRAAFGPSLFTLTGQLVAIQDREDPERDGCQTALNTSALRGKIALIDRGLCFFVDKVKNAQSAGAIGVIVVDQKGETSPITMAGEDASVTIPSLFLLKKDGDTLTQLLAEGSVNLTLSRSQNKDLIGAMDTSVVAHEWGHFIVERLVGNGNGLSNDQGLSLSEGWADFHALLLMVGPEEAGVAAYQGAYPVGSYVTSNSPELQPFYFGLRRVPYSIDFKKNALTFKHIQDSVFLPTTPPFQDDGGQNSESHNAGEIWATALWEVYAALLKDTPRLSFTEAQQRMKRYLVASYKLTPMDPTFTEARDALLAVALANDSQDYALMKAAFARRGLGVGATSPSRYSSSNSGLKESFVSQEPMSLMKVTLEPKAGTCDQDKVLDVGETAQLTVTLRNDGLGTASPMTATFTSTNDVKFSNGGVMTFAQTRSKESVTGVIDVTLNSAAFFATLKLNAEFNVPVAHVTSESFTWPVNYDLVPAFKQDLVEKSISDWTAETISDNPEDGWTIQPNGVYSAIDPDHQADLRWISPVIQVADQGSFRFRFDHSYAFEQDADGMWDGGVVELSMDGGPWVDLGSSITPGYNGTIRSTNPVLASRQGFVGSSKGYPAVITESVDLGQSYNGHKVRIRFRVGSDLFEGGKGWTIGNIRFENITNLPFTAVVANSGSCSTSPPASRALQGIVQGVKTGDTVTITAISPINGIQKSVNLVGTGQDLRYVIAGLSATSGYRLQVLSDKYWNGFWGGTVGGEPLNVVSYARSAAVDLSGGDMAGVHLRLTARTDPIQSDKDGDGWPDDADNCPDVTNPDQLDQDGDGIGNQCDLDNDNDGLPDTYELANNLNPFDAHDGTLDPDGDGVSTLLEYQRGSDPNGPALSDAVRQTLTPVFKTISMVPGYAAPIRWEYQTSDGSKKLPSTGLQVSFDATRLRFVEVQPAPLSIITTPSLLTLSYGSSDLSGLLFTFALLADLPLGTQTTIQITPVERVSGFHFEAMPVTVTAEGFDWDVDHNGAASALSDGLLILRHLAGITGKTLVVGAVDPSGKRTDANAIHDF
ncbi:MAG: M36 family metallopeptidase, partial [Magnetococcales bacterium]|nr:M36 family metallopeptidase [Magnetococcales bacterium]